MPELTPSAGIGTKKGCADKALARQGPYVRVVWGCGEQQGQLSGGGEAGQGGAGAGAHTATR